MSIARLVPQALKYSSQVSHILVTMVTSFWFLVPSWLVTSEREKLVENVVERFLRDQALSRIHINKKHITQSTRDTRTWTGGSNCVDNDRTAQDTAAVWKSIPLSQGQGLWPNRMVIHSRRVIQQYVIHGDTAGRWYRRRVMHRQKVDTSITRDTAEEWHNSTWYRRRLIHSRRTIQ